MVRREPKMLREGRIMLIKMGCPIINPNASQRIGKQLPSTALI
jgi:hypothetical protein